MAGRWYAPAPSNRSHHWCGPYAIAAIIGRDYLPVYNDCVFVLNRAAKGVAGMYTSEVTKVLRFYGKTVVKLPMEERYNMIRRPAKRLSLSGGVTLCTKERMEYGRPKTLAQWYKGREDKQATYLVNVTRHFVVVRGTRIIDNNSMAWEPFHARRKDKRAMVREVFRIT